jgi:primase-polymerase (primpol)-like protein
VSGRSKDQDLIDWLAAQMQRADEKVAETNGHARPMPASPSPDHTDEEIIEKCRAAENAAKFEALFDHGDVHAYHGGDDSAADLALLSMLAFYTQDPRRWGRGRSGDAATTTASARSVSLCQA